MNDNLDGGITPALKESLPYVLAGMTAPQMADVLDISVDAARARIWRLMRLGLVKTVRSRREKAAGAMANIARTALVDGEVPIPFRLPAGTPAAVRNWLRAEGRISKVDVEEMVRVILVDAYFDAVGNEA